MASISFKMAAVAVLLLGTLLLCSGTGTSMDEPAAFGYRHPAPAQAPSTKPVVQPAIIVQGVIYCKSCHLSGYNAGMDASPLPNATAKLVCYGGAGSKGGYRVLNMTSTATNKDGYFLVMVYDLAMFRRGSCRVYLRSSPTALCDVPFHPADPAAGIVLERDEVKPSSPLPVGVRAVYSARPALMYAPRMGAKCPAANY